MSRASGISAKTSLRQVAFIVCTALDGAGVQVVLTGGSAATVYAPEAYQSRDLDFVIAFQSKGPMANQALERLGYHVQGNIYVHDASDLTLDFPPGPLTVGGEQVKDWDRLVDGRRHLNILKPTDVCRDRLAGFLFWNDRGSLEQAVAVARAQRDRVDFDSIRTWCARERAEEKFLQFRRQLG